MANVAAMAREAGETVTGPSMGRAPMRPRAAPTSAPATDATPVDWSRSRHGAHHNVGSDRPADPLRTPEGTLVIGEEYSEVLRDIRAGQRIVVIFHFHRSPNFSAGLLRQTSNQTGRETGVFDTCSPVRPNPIGMSVLEVLGVRGASIDVKRLDMGPRYYP